MYKMCIRSICIINIVYKGICTHGGRARPTKISSSTVLWHCNRAQKRACWFPLYTIQKLEAEQSLWNTESVERVAGNAVLIRFQIPAWKKLRSFFQEDFFWEVFFSSRILLRRFLLRFKKIEKISFEVQEDFFLSRKFLLEVQKDREDFFQNSKRFLLKLRKIYSFQEDFTCKDFFPKFPEDFLREYLI